MAQGYRIWFWRGLRLSAVVGLLAAGWDAWAQASRFSTSELENQFQSTITFTIRPRAPS